MSLGATPQQLSALLGEPPTNTAQPEAAASAARPGAVHGVSGAQHAQPTGHHTNAAIRAIMRSRAAHDQVRSTNVMQCV
jgi:hypothetical protein